MAKRSGLPGPGALEVALGNEDDDNPQAKPETGGNSACKVGAVAAAVALVVCILLCSRRYGGDGPPSQVSVASAEGSRTPPVVGPSSAPAASESNPVAVFNTSMGVFEAEIFVDRVPITASNFIDLAQSSFYDGLHFHRVIKDFMVQFGCPLSADPQSPRAGTGGPQDGTFTNLKSHGQEKRSNRGNIRDEHLSKDSNKPGTLSMANTGRPNSGGSQFFVNVHDNSYLDWFSPGRAQHPVFGKVVKNYDVVEAISRVKTASDRPVTPVKMNSIRIIRA